MNESFWVPTARTALCGVGLGLGLLCYRRRDLSPLCFNHDVFYVAM